MHSLAELQADFAHRLFNPEAAIPSSLKSEQQSPKNQQRFAVYRNNVIASLIEAMGDNFPVVNRLVGDECFTAISRLWVTENPPPQPMLFQYGTGFAEFLDGFSPLQELPYLGDVARLEQARREAYYASDAPGLSINTLQDFSENYLAGLVFQLHPSARVIESHYPVHTLWEYNTSGETHTELDLQDCPPENVFVVRPQHDVHHHFIGAADAVFIAALLQGRPLGEAANLADSQLDFELASVLGLVFQTGGVSKLTLTEK